LFSASNQSPSGQRLFRKTKPVGGDMRKFLFCFLGMIFASISILHADTETLQWYVDGNLYTTTTCESGGDVILPPTPTKTGYNFDGWVRYYIPIEYLESTGTQYIDTGVEKTLKSKYKFITRISYSDTTTRQLNGGQGYIYFGVISGHYQIAQGGGEYRDINAVPNVFANCEIEFDCPNNTVSFNINDRYGIAHVVYSNLYPYGGLYLFNLDNKNFPGKEKISYFKIYQDDTLVRDFIPVLDQYGIPCMYDKVSGEFFYNQGTGQFIAGPAVGE
jgi:hypothetical protein